MVLQELREHKQGWSWGGSTQYSVPAATSLLLNQSFKERKGGHRGREIMPKFPILLSWRDQGNHRRRSAAHGSATFRFHLSVWWAWPEPRLLWHEPWYCCNDLVAESQAGALTRVLRKTRTRPDTGKVFVACFLSVCCWVFRNWLYPTFVKQEFFCSGVSEVPPSWQVQPLRVWHRGSWCQCHTPLGA